MFRTIPILFCALLVLFSCSTDDNTAASKLYDAIIEYDVVSARKYIPKADLKVTFENDLTLLHIAARSGQLEIVSLLLQHGMQVDCKTTQGFTPLHAAAAEGRTNVARFLIQKGADVNSKTNNGFTPLDAALTNKSAGETVALLKEKGAVSKFGLDYLTPKHQHTYDPSLDLGGPAVIGDLREIKKRIAKGANVDYKDSFGMTALHYASDHHHIKIVKFLISHGADVNARQWEGRTPLNYATANGDMKISKLLIRSGADVNIPNSNGMTPLHNAASAASHRLVEYLIQHGANCNARNREKGTPLHFAAYFGDVAIVRILVEAGAEINVKDIDGSTPIKVALKANKLEIADYLRIAATKKK